MRFRAPLTLIVSAILLPGAAPARADDTLGKAYREAESYLKNRQADPGPRPYPEHERPERPEHRDPEPDPGPSPRQIERERKERERKAEQARIEGNRQAITAGLATAAQRPVLTPPAEPPPDPNAITRRYAEFQAILAAAPQGNEIYQEPITKRGAWIERMLASDRARNIRDSILRNAPLQVEVADNPSVQADPTPWYYWEDFQEVTYNNFAITEAVRNSRVEADLVRAIIWMESTHGWYDTLEKPAQRKSLLPMNIYVDYWKGLGLNREDMGNRFENIRAGVKILDALWTRIENPNVEKVATLYNNLSVSEVSVYGKTVDYFYRTRPWLHYGNRQR